MAGKLGGASPQHTVPHAREGQRRHTAPAVQTLLRECGPSTPFRRVWPRLRELLLITETVLRAHSRGDGQEEPVAEGRQMSPVREEVTIHSRKQDGGQCQAYPYGITRFGASVHGAPGQGRGLWGSALHGRCPHWPRGPLRTDACYTRLPGSPDPWGGSAHVAAVGQRCTEAGPPKGMEG